METKNTPFAPVIAKVPVDEHAKVVKPTTRKHHWRTTDEIDHPVTVRKTD